MCKTLIRNLVLCSVSSLYITRVYPSRSSHAKWTPFLCLFCIVWLGVMTVENKITKEDFNVSLITIILMVRSPETKQHFWFQKEVADELITATSVLPKEFSEMLHQYFCVCMQCKTLSNSLSFCVCPLVHNTLRSPFFFFFFFSFTAGFWTDCLKLFSKRFIINY